MGMNRRIGMLLAGAALVTTALAGCASGGTDGSGDAGPTPTETTAATTPGTAACDLVTGRGSVTLEETADAYRIEWTGVPVDPDDNRTTYEVQLGNDEMQGGVDLYVEYDTVTGTTYGVMPQGSNAVDPIDGEPETSGGTIVGTFPKDDALTPTWWSPKYTVIDDSGATSTVCTDDGQVMDYEPLS